MKKRRHTNSNGLRQRQTGSYLTELLQLAKKMKIPFEFNSHKKGNKNDICNR